MKTSKWCIPVGRASFALLSASVVACGLGQQGNTVCLSASAKNSSPQNLLALSYGYSSPSNGAGYLDIQTTDVSGNALSRRCSVMVAPTGSNTEQVKVWTAVHCLFDADSPEFVNSSYSLQLFFKNGYIAIPIQFEGVSELAKVASAVSPFLSMAPKRERDQWRSALSEESVAPCQQQTQLFAAQLGENRKNIACFSKNEIRVLTGKIEPKLNRKFYVSRILEDVKRWHAQTLSALPDLDKKYLAALESHRPLSAKLPIYMRTYGYWLNEKHCSTPESELPVDHLGRRETQAFCGNRELFIQRVQKTIPEQYPLFAEVADAKPADAVELSKLHSSLFGCNIEKIEDFSTKNLEFKTVCDREKLTRLVWAKLVNKGVDSLKENALLKPGVFGFNTDSYFTLLFNNSSTTNPRGSIISLTPDVGQMSPADLNATVILTNFDNQNSQLKLSKTDSGSMLSVFGTVPIATLSTLDGEPTSGGTSILPLPSYSEDYASVATPTLCKSR
jgi:hypothetical protein